MSDFFICPVCKEERPTNPHLDWCDYDGPEIEEEE